ncbi:hypothetical protein CBL_08304 [Carabus blaptoides fortunei]
MGYALLRRGQTTACAVCLSVVAFSSVVSQVVSLRWYLNTRPSRTSSKELQKLSHRVALWVAVALHTFQLGILWRYAKLFIPVDLRYVKHEVRDLCMLRLVHAFCEAAPMLLLQLYLLISRDPSHPPSKPFSDLNVVSVALSLFAVCWALASFSKNVRLQNVHRLVLTWLGVIFQFLWRLGTVSARVTSLTIYASLYAHWVFLVIGLHWISMFLWLISPKNVFHGERISRKRKACLSALIAFVYVFAYVNLQEVNHRQKMIIFYVVMVLENSLLIVSWLAGIWMDRPDRWYLVPVLVLCLFAIGLSFMLLYYRYFHVRRLGYEAGGRLPQLNGNNNYCTTCGGLCECGPVQANMDSPSLQVDVKPCVQNGTKVEVIAVQPSVEAKQIVRYHQHAIPGVFNCRFSNPVSSCAATKRKKKKPTSFVPPPTIASLGQAAHNNLGPTPVPFWRRPLPTQHSHQGGSSENECSSVGSRVNIHQKLQEKKQKQLAELKIIEEEIKQGKLGGPIANSPLPGEDIYSSLARQPIPRTKKHVEPLCWPPPSPDIQDIDDGADFQQSHEMNANMNGNLNKLSNYKQNLGDLANMNANLNNLGALNNLSTYGLLANNLASRISPSQNLNSLGIYGQNINSIDSIGSVHSRSPNQNVGELGELGGLSPILSSDNGSIPRQILPKSKLRGYERRDESSASISSRMNVYSDANLGFRAIQNAYADRRDESRQIQSQNISPRPFRPPYPYHLVPPPRTKQNAPLPRSSRSKTPEILLAPHYLDNTRVYYDWGGERHFYQPDEDNSTLQRRNEPNSVSDCENIVDSQCEQNMDDNACMYKSYRIPSDIDSQISLPRSYTLPREFKYYRRGRPRKQIKNDHFVASTNSSDGDVDSADDNESNTSSPHLSPSTTNHNRVLNHQQQQQQQHKPGYVKQIRRPYGYRGQSGISSLVSVSTITSQQPTNQTL